MAVACMQSMQAIAANFLSQNIYRVFKIYSHFLQTEVTIKRYTKTIKIKANESSKTKRRKNTN